MEALHELQSRILSTRSYSDRVREAFFKVPRHHFVNRFRESGSSQWIDLNDENRAAHFEMIYRDQPLVIWGSIEDFQANEPRPVSTISQPSFVLYQLDLLDLQPGHAVFELGTGSGWNAALIAHLCRPGPVYTFEIIAPLAEQARRRLQNMGFDNVRVFTGDGMNFPDLSFERGIFTAGATDLPLALHRAMAVGGLLLFVLQDDEGLDYLLVLRKTEREFVSEKIIPCGFVSVTGQDKNLSFRMAPVLNELGAKWRDLRVRILPAGQTWQAQRPTVVVRQPQSTFLWSRI